MESQQPREATLQQTQGPRGQFRPLGRTAAGAGQRSSALPFWCDLMEFNTGLNWLNSFSGFFYGVLKIASPNFLGTQVMNRSITFHMGFVW